MDGRYSCHHGVETVDQASHDISPQDQTSGGGNVDAASGKARLKPRSSKMMPCAVRNWMIVGMNKNRNSSRSLQCIDHPGVDTEQLNVDELANLSFNEWILPWLRRLDQHVEERRRCRGRKV